MRGLLNPLLVRSSARPLVRPVHAPSALIRPSARSPVRLQSRCRPPIRPSAPRLPVRLSFAPRPPLRSSASRPPARHSPPVHPSSTRPPVRRSPPVHPPSAPSTPSAPSASSKNYLPVSSGPKFFTSCTPREIATSAIRGASKSHSGIRVSKLPPYVVNPGLTLLCRDKEVRHDPSCRDIMTSS